MAKSIGFRNRFPHFGLFLIIAVALSIPLTVYSLNNVSTQTKQEAATYTCSVAQNKVCQGKNPGYCNFSNCEYYTSRCNATNPKSCFYGAHSSCAAAGIPCVIKPTPTCSSAGGTCTTKTICAAEGTFITGVSGCSLGTVNNVCCKLNTQTYTCSQTGGLCLTSSSACATSGLVNGVGTCPNNGQCCTKPSPTATPIIDPGQAKCASIGGKCYYSLTPTTICPNAMTNLGNICSTANSTSMYPCCK